MARSTVLSSGGALNTAYDDGNSNDNFSFASGNGAAGTVNATVGQGNGDIEALLLTGAGGEGVTNANLGNAALVSAAFNTEFDITAANGEDALLVINDTDANSFALWQWMQAGGGEISASELSLIATVNANATVNASSFDFDGTVGVGGSSPIFGLAGSDNIAGTGGDDTIYGSGGNDTINAQGGNDTIVWNAPNDGRDFIDGGANTGTGDRFVLNGDGQGKPSLYGRRVPISPEVSTPTLKLWSPAMASLWLNSTISRN